MLFNQEKIINKISNFLSDYIDSCNRKALFVIYKGDISDWLCIRLCEEARKKCGCDVYFTSLQSIIFDFDVAKQIQISELNFRNELIDFLDDKDCIVVSGLNINKGLIHRAFSKHNSIADLYPVLDLYYSECVDLAKYFGINSNLYDSCLDHDSKLQFYKPEYEYLHKEDLKNGIISSNTIPTRHKDWWKYTKPQKDLIAKLHQRNKLTQHKDLLKSNVLFPKLREIVK